jgi:ABC-type enterobactin transport system permease subunit
VTGIAALAQAADALTFAAMFAFLGPASELNPLVHVVGPGVALAAKAGLIAYVALVATALRRRRPRTRRVVLGAAFSAGAIGAIANVWTLGAWL